MDILEHIFELGCDDISKGGDSNYFNVLGQYPGRGYVLCKNKRHWLLKGNRCKKCVKESSEKYYKKNKKKLLESASLWAKENKHKVRERSIRKYAQKKKAFPSWANKNKIQEIYKNAVQLTKEKNTVYQVDHIYPLRSKWMCGLHVENNLQIITAEENLKKGNRVWPGQLDCQKCSVYDIFSKELTDLLND